MHLWSSEDALQCSFVTGLVTGTFTAPWSSSWFGGVIV